MPSIQRFAALFVGLGVVGALATACIDLTPITDIPARPDAGIVVTGPDALAKNPCFACATGANDAAARCNDEYATCRSDPKCLAMFVCGIPRDCYAMGQDLIACLTACAITAGLTGIHAPALPPFIALQQCATTSCSAACEASDAAAPE